MLSYSYTLRTLIESAENITRHEHCDINNARFTFFVTVYASALKCLETFGTVWTWKGEILVVKK